MRDELLCGAPADPDVGADGAGVAAGSDQKDGLSDAAAIPRASHESRLTPEEVRRRFALLESLKEAAKEGNGGRARRYR